ncbi:MAG TPA: TMEM175 family protein [Saprospiraceae bacterium]|nr:TMEM175 family protein [Saprospiraceae bacterium]
MAAERHIDKSRLTFFTDALLAIIMTILVLDIKVPEGLEGLNGEECFKNIMHVFPHLVGFLISFAFIVVLWFSHHDLMESLHYANRPLARLNFCFIATTATLPFSTALAAAYPAQSYAVATLALNMFFMNIFLAGLHMYAIVTGLRDMNYFPARYLRIKQWLGMIGGFVFLAALFVAFLNPHIALVMIAAVPLMHVMPIPNE